MVHIKRILLACSIVFLGASWALAKGPETIRICIGQHKTKAIISIPYPYQIRALYTHDIIARERTLSYAELKVTPAGLSLGGKEYKIFGFDIVPLNLTRDEIKINNRRYRGVLRCLKTPDQKLLFVNIVTIEEYLYGVLYSEISHQWPDAAKKAQAICSRTFAMYKKSIHAKHDFDVTSDVYSQVYGGLYAERPCVKEAVDSTRGLVLTYNGNIFPAFFHATCGGHTEHANTLWRIAIPPLEGRVCSYCTHSPYFFWEQYISYEDIEKKLTQHGFDVGKISQIQIKETTPSGRVFRLVIKDDKGLIEISGKDFRQKVGPDLIRSLLFTMIDKDQGILFSGHGWGHGVGLCQWGCFGMAEKGCSFEEILDFYFPGATIEKKETV